ncbi:MAG: acyltransferase family protein, partial [Microthrixaceae bacterium]|nr:acyltransferase family protein [Microthrixaceae bacterium]
LAPMALVTLAGITAATMIRPFFWGRDDVGGDTIAAALHGVNWWFVSGSRGYDGPTDIPSPVQHFWSLSVEEQFYLVLPLLLAAALWWAARRSLNRVSVVVVTASVAAAASVVIGLLTGGERAYFGTDTRAVELLVGVIAGALAHDGTLSDARTRRLLGRVGPVMLAGLIATWVAAPASTQWMFNGWLVLVAGAAAVLVAGADATAETVGLLRHPVAVGIGRRSYSLYLVHWPVLLATDPRTLDTPSAVRWAVRFVVIVALTELGYRIVETPIRRRRGFGGVRLAAAYLGALVVLIVLVLPTIPTATAPSQPLATGLPPTVASRFERDGELARLGRRPEMLPQPDDDLPALVLRGDSTARFLGGPLSYYAPELGYRLVNLGAPGCVLGGNPGSDPDLPEGCPTIADERVVAEVLAPEAVVFTFGIADVAFLAAEQPELFAQRVEEAVSAYSEVGASVVLVAPWPEPTWQQATRPADLATVTSTLTRVADETDGVVLSDGGGLFDGERQDDRALRPDGVHIYDQALGRRVVADTLGPALGEALREASAEAT